MTFPRVISNPQKSGKSATSHADYVKCESPFVCASDPRDAEPDRMRIAVRFYGAPRRQLPTLMQMMGHRDIRMTLP
jgi:hypothetical protein